MNHLISLSKAKEKLSAKEFQRFTVMMQHGTMQLEYFAPYKNDTQTPHTQDELYFIVNGSATLEKPGELLECKTGDVLFIPAGMIHRFIKFSDDFETWVIFYGPDGGELTQ